MVRFVKNVVILALASTSITACNYLGIKMVDLGFKNIAKKQHNEDFDIDE